MSDFTVIRCSLGDDLIFFRTILSRPETSIDADWEKEDEIGWEATGRQSAECRGSNSGFLAVAEQLAIDAWQIEMSPTISISRDGVWAGDGEIGAFGVIINSPAILGEDQDASDETYEAISDAIEEGETEVVRPDGTYTWTITPAKSGVKCEIVED